MLDLIRGEKRLFDNLFDEFTGRTNRHLLMKTDIKEDDQAYTFQIDLPGFEKNDIKIKVERGYLVVSASKSSDKEEKNDHYIRRERSFGEVSRSYYIGDVSQDALRASFNNGTLELIVPKEAQVKETKYLTIE